MSGMSEFADSREETLSSEQLGLFKNPEIAAAWNREIALCRSLTEREAQALEEGRELPSSSRIIELCSTLGLTPEHCESLLRGVAAIFGEGLPPRSQEDAIGTGLREFVVDLRGAVTDEGVVQALNEGLCVPVGGRWSGRSWSAFNDYLSWPTEDRYKLRFLGFEDCLGLSSQDREMIETILTDNPHVIVAFD